jgi:hypothetical protein
MAAPILCNGPDGGPAAVMVTLIEAAETQGLCGPCFIDFCEATLKAAAPERLRQPDPAPARKPRAKRTAAAAAATAAGSDGQAPGGES